MKRFEYPGISSNADAATQLRQIKGSIYDMIDTLNYNLALIETRLESLEETISTMQEGEE